MTIGSTFLTWRRQPRRKHALKLELRLHRLPLRTKSQKEKKERKDKQLKS
jgi:hypothetical protein